MFRWLKRLTLLALAAALLWLLRAYPLRALGGYLVVQEEPRSAQAILVLSGESPARILCAYDLFKKGFSPFILLTRGPRRRAEEILVQRGIAYQNEADMDRQTLVKLGVPEAGAVLLPDRVTSTYEEAQAVKPYLKGRSVHTLLLVTSRYHSRRAKMIFERVFAGAIDVVSVPTRYDEYEARNWWQSRENLKHVLSEYQKLTWYHAAFLWDSLREAWSLSEKIQEDQAIQ